MNEHEPARDRRRARIRHLFQIATLLGLLWTMTIVLTGGISTRLFDIRVSSRNPVGALLCTLAFALGVWWWSRPDLRAAWRQDLTALRAWRARWPFSRAFTLVILLAVCLAGIQVWQWAGGRPLWLDEQMIALNLRERGVTALMGSLWLDQSAPLGWLVIERLAVVAFGDGEVALRLLPTMSFVATLVVSVWIGRRWLGTAGALTLVLLMGTAQWITFYATELKPYASDVFWALWLPALAVWAAEAPDLSGLRRRMAVWWGAAAAGQMMAFGALFVTPCGAMLLALTAWRRHGVREVLRIVPLGLLWLGAFATHYLLSIRYASANSFLTGYWAFALRPSGAGLFETVTWAVERLSAFAVKPGGATWAGLFWGAALAGWCVSRRPLGWIMASVPAMAVLLAVVRAVPLYERLALWTMPAVLVGVALAIDWAIRHGAGARLARAAVALAAVCVVLDLVPHGIREINRGVVTNHALDDRTGIEWALSMRRPGDIVITTELSLPALWWYGRVPVAPPTEGQHLEDGVPIIQARFRPGRRVCDDAALQVAPGARYVVYLGFRFDDVPPGFDQLLFDTLGHQATLIALHEPEGIGRAALIEPGVAVAMPQLDPRFPDEPAVPDGCIDFVQARRR